MKQTTPPTQGAPTQATVTPTLAPVHGTQTQATSTPASAPGQTAGPTGALEIAPADPQDVPLLLSLIKELADFEKLQHEVVATETSLRNALFGARPGAEAVVARVDGEAAGFALYFHNFSTFLGSHGLYLEDLFVRPAFRGRAVGKSLLIHLAKLAVQRGCGRFEWAVLDWNRPARDFYEALGAEANSAWINYRITGEALRRLADTSGAGP